ncbi:MAG: hypothetical protein CMF19_07960 [Idiomarinaceae bacterium]|nr:hypothetical protein [Idiomarinaceae bacterium]
MRQAQSPYATGERDISELPADIARTTGALAKGAAIGTAGAPGDILGLARGIGAAIGAEEGERMDAFVQGFDEISKKYGTGALNEMAELLGETLGLRLAQEGDELGLEMVEQGQLAGEFLGLGPATKIGSKMVREGARMQRSPYAQMGAAGDLADVIRQKIVPGKKLFAQPEEVRRFFAEGEGLAFTDQFVAQAKTMDTYEPGASASTMMTGDDLLKFFGDAPDDVDDLRRVLDIRAAEMEKKPQDRMQPSGQDPLFDTSPEAYQADLPEQKDTPVPRAPEGKKLPKGDRAAPVAAMQSEIADVLAERMRPHLGTAAQYFYNTGPIIRKAIEMGIPEAQAREQLKKFALNYAATSPRTMTEQNLRNASLVSAKEARDIPLTEVVGPGGTGINEKGYPMMIGPSGIHRLLVDAKNAEGISYNTNPKPATFAENVMGNLQGVTVDTHAIRGALDAMNEVQPGSIPDGFIKPEFREQYKADPSSLDPAKMIDDTLGDQKVDGEKMQTEYAVFSDLYKAAAQRVGVSPAEAQSLGWFGSGDKTGLASDLKTVVDLLDERIDVTAQALNRPKEKVFVDFMSGKIPLLSFGGMTLLETGSMMEEENNGDT